MYSPSDDAAHPTSPISFSPDQVLGQSLDTSMTDQGHHDLVAYNDGNHHFNTYDSHDQGANDHAHHDYGHHNHLHPDRTQSSFDLHPWTETHQEIHTHNDHNLHTDVAIDSHDHSTIDSHSEFAQGQFSHDHHSSHLFSAHSQSDDNRPHVGIDSSGTIYKYPAGKSYDCETVGYVNSRSFYNNRGDYLGYVGRDGNVYNNHDQLLGWERGGTIYDKNGCAIEGAQHTSNGAIGAGCYLLFIRYGGVD